MDRCGLCVWGAGLCAAACSAVLGQGDSPWTIVPSPNGTPEPLGSTLLSVAAISPMNAWAVGAHPNPAQCV